MLIGISDQAARRCAPPTIGWVNGLTVDKPKSRNSVGNIDISQTSIEIPLAILSSLP